MFTSLKWAIIFFVIALLAGALGFTGVARGASSIAKVLFAVFLVLAIIVTLLVVFAAKAVT